MAASVRDVPVHVMKGAFRAGGLEPVRDEEHGVVLTHERRFGPGLRLVFRHGPLDGTHASIREVGFYSGTSRVPYERVDPHAFSDGAAVLVGLTRG